MLILVVFWLQDTTRSQEEGITLKICRQAFYFTVELTIGFPEPTTFHLCHDEQQLQPGDIHAVAINCGNRKSVQVHCANTHNYTICDGSDMYGNDHVTISIEYDCRHDEYISKPGTTTTSDDKLNSCNNSLTIALLGAIVGLLLLLLVTVTSILVWTCWLLKKRGEMKYNAEYQIR